jgi:hypothetical protein
VANPELGETLREQDDMTDRAAREASPSAWQEKLLPLMRWMLVSLTAFFIAATLYQAYSLQQRIVALGSEEFRLPTDATGTDTDTWKARIGLEAYAIRHRYQHSSLILMSRAWIIYLGFVTGMILAMVGATFILGKIREPESQLAAKGQVGELSFKSASPGLTMAVLGTALMICTMVIRADVTVTDTPLYFLPEVRVPAGTTPLSPPGRLSDGVRPTSKLDDSGLDSLRNQEKERSATKR